MIGDATVCGDLKVKLLTTDRDQQISITTQSLDNMQATVSGANATVKFDYTVGGYTTNLGGVAIETPNVLAPVHAKVTLKLVAGLPSATGSTPTPTAGSNAWPAARLSCVAGELARKADVDPPARVARLRYAALGLPRGTSAIQPIPARKSPRFLTRDTVVNIKGGSYRMRAHMPLGKEGAAMLG
jgi:hypothetical protein